jgi:hypothetical protein
MTAVNNDESVNLSNFAGFGSTLFGFSHITVLCRICRDKETKYWDRRFRKW